VALPSIDTDLAFSAGDLQWVMSAYLLSFGGLLLILNARNDVSPGRAGPRALKSACSPDDSPGSEHQAG
jgi:hypothetical protein